MKNLAFATKIIQSLTIFQKNIKQKHS